MKASTKLAAAVMDNSAQNLAALRWTSSVGDPGSVAGTADNSERFLQQAAAHLIDFNVAAVSRTDTLVVVPKSLSMNEIRARAVQFTRDWQDEPGDERQQAQSYVREPKPSNSFATLTRVERSIDEALTFWMNTTARSFSSVSM